MATSAVELDFDIFQRHLATVASVVRSLVCERNWEHPIFTLVEERLKAHSPKCLRAFFFGVAQRLLDLRDGRGLRQHAGFINWCQIGGSDAHAESDEQADKHYVEYLTAAGLALYFLGEPFSQPWEHVRKWVDSKDGGGLPNGVCVAKAIGDIIRGARLAYMRKHTALSRNREPIAPVEMHLTVLSHLPVVLFESLLMEPEHKEDCVPDEAHVLGRCYEMLQLRLYANEGLPIKYFIAEDTVRPRLETQSNKLQAWNDMIAWLCGTVFANDFPNQWVCLVGVQTLPAVFLNHNTGLYTFATKRQPLYPTIEMPFPASYLQEARRKLYQVALASIDVTDPNNNLLPSGRQDGAKAARERLLGL